MILDASYVGINKNRTKNLVNTSDYYKVMLTREMTATESLHLQR